MLIHKHTGLNSRSFSSHNPGHYRRRNHNILRLQEVCHILSALIQDGNHPRRGLPPRYRLSEETKDLLRFLGILPCLQTQHRTRFILAYPVPYQLFVLHHLHRRRLCARYPLRHLHALHSPQRLYARYRLQHQSFLRSIRIVLHRLLRLLYPNNPPPKLVLRSLSLFFHPNLPLIVVLRLPRLPFFPHNHPPQSDLRSLNPSFLRSRLSTIVLHRLQLQLLLLSALLLLQYLLLWHRINIALTFALRVKHQHIRQSHCRIIHSVAGLKIRSQILSPSTLICKRSTTDLH